MRTIQPPIFNVKRPGFPGPRPAHGWALKLLLAGLFLSAVTLPAQVPVQLSPAAQTQLQIVQPAVQIAPAAAATATAEFSAASIGVGEKVFYRVNVTASESTFTLPAEIPAAKELTILRSAHGQISQLSGGRFEQLTSYVFEMQATAPGHFTVSNFTLQVNGQTLEVPSAGVDVVADNSAAAPPRRLRLETSVTNLYLGEPFRVRVIWPVDQTRAIEALREVQFNGGGLMADKLSTRQSVEPVNHDGRLTPAFVYETVLMPIALGDSEIDAQAFTAGREFGGPVTITGNVTIPGGPPKYSLLLSDAKEIHVRPLPTDNQPPGFTGAMGKFLMDVPELSTNRIQVGEPVQLKIGFHGIGNLTRFAPPATPRSDDWQVIANQPPGSGFTLIPLTDEVHTTPAIPFCSFDSATGKYLDLTIPALPITVVGEGLPVQLRDGNENNPEPLKLSALASVPGWSASHLRPLQLRGWFVGLQLLPVFGLMALWQWDRRRRFLEAHPEIVRRRQARRALRREKRRLQSAVQAGDATLFVRHATEALCVAVAPHFPAQPQALVCGDVLSQLDEADAAGPAGETVRQIFVAADARFAPAPHQSADLLAWHSRLETVLRKLEERL